MVTYFYDPVDWSIEREMFRSTGRRDGRRLTSSSVVTEDSCLTAQVGWSNVVGLTTVAVAPGTAEDTAPLLIGATSDSSTTAGGEQEKRRRDQRELR